MASYPCQYENSVTLKGRVGKAPVKRSLPRDSTAVCNFSVATRKVIKDKTYTEWHQIACYGALAEAVTCDFGAGDFVYVKGEIRARDMQTSEGKANGWKPRKVIEIIAREAYPLIKNTKGQGETSADHGEPPPLLDPIDEAANGAADEFAPYV